MYIYLYKNKEHNMNREDVFKTINAMLKFAKDGAPAADTAKPEVPASNGVSAKTKDGMMLASPADKFDVGVDVYILKDDGSKEDVQDGDIVMDDGSVITVKDKKIEKIEPMALEPGKDTEPVVAVAMSKEKMEEVISSNTKLNEELNDLKEKFSKLTEATKMITEEFSKIPGADKVNLTMPEVEDFSKKVLSKRDRNRNEIYEVLAEAQKK